MVDEKSDAAELLAVDAHAAYVSTRDGKIRAISLTSHRSLWTVPSPVRTTADNPAKAAAGRGHLVVHGSDGKVASLTTRSGKVVWGPKPQGSDDTALRPVINEGTVYLGGKTLAALRLADGAVTWSQRAESGTGWGSPAVDGDEIYAVDGVNLQAYKSADGTSNWTVLLKARELPRDTAPVVQGHTAWLALAADGTDGVVAVDTRTGQVAWPYTQGSGGPWDIAAAGNRTFLQHEGKLAAMPVI